MRLIRSLGCAFAILGGCTSFGGDPTASPADDGGVPDGATDAGSSSDSASFFPAGCLFCSDFETAPIESGWLLGGTADKAVYAPTSDAPHSGKTALKFQIPAAAGIQKRFFLHDLDAVPAGSTFEYTFWTRVDATDVSKQGLVEIAAFTFGAVDAATGSQPRQAQVRLMGGAITARIQAAPTGTEVDLASSQVLTAGWHAVKLTVTLESASTGEIALSVDNAVVEKRSFDPDGPRTDHFQIQLGCDYSDGENSTPIELDFDDVSVTVK